MKVKSYGHLASEVSICVDDRCIIAQSDIVYWQAAKRFVLFLINQEFNMRLVNRNKILSLRANGEEHWCIPQTINWWSKLQRLNGEKVVLS